MHLPLRSTRLLLLTCAALTFSETAPAQARPQLSAEQVVENLVRMNLERAQALPAYRSTRIYRAEYHGFPGSRSAEMIVDMEFKPPATKLFTIRSETGSRVIIDRVFKKLMEEEKEAFQTENQRRIALNNDNYVFTLLGYESTPDGSLYLLAVEPKTKSKFLYRGKIWVDANDFAVARIAAEPAKNPSFWIRQTKIEQLYGKVDEFWLPHLNHSVSAVRLGGRADFSIQYRDYQMSGASPVGRSDGRVGSPQ